MSEHLKVQSRHFRFGLALVLAVVLTGTTGCSDGGKLTSAKAEEALKEWAEVAVNVAGVHELPEQNAAEVSFTLYEFIYNERAGGKKVSYSGPAKAAFVRYNDDRWVLKRVTFVDPKQPVWARTKNFDVN